VGIGGKRYVVVSLDRHRRKSLRRGIFHTHEDRERAEEEADASDEEWGST
jgi:hypothetical protein